MSGRNIVKGGERIAERFFPEPKTTTELVLGISSFLSGTVSAVSHPFWEKRRYSIDTLIQIGILDQSIERYVGDELSKRITEGVQSFLGKFKEGINGDDLTQLELLAEIVKGLGDIRDALHNAVEDLGEDALYNPRTKMLSHRITLRDRKSGCTDWYHMSSGNHYTTKAIVHSPDPEGKMVEFETLESNKITGAFFGKWTGNLSISGRVENVKKLFGPCHDAVMQVLYKPGYSTDYKYTAEIFVPDQSNQGRGTINYPCYNESLVKYIGEVKLDPNKGSVVPHGKGDLQVQIRDDSDSPTITKNVDGSWNEGKLVPRKMANKPKSTGT
jgi:hypothetical protein